VLDIIRTRLFGMDAAEMPEMAGAMHKLERLFGKSGVQQRHGAIDFAAFYSRPRSTGERMAEYARYALPLGREAVKSCLEAAADQIGQRAFDSLSDFIVTSCTGYSAPGIDIQIARDLGLRGDVRRTIIGHMGCFAAIVGMRQALSAVRARPGSSALLLSVELSSLHFAPNPDPEIMTCMSLFGDAAGSLLLTDAPGVNGPQLVDTYCAADFSTAEQMSWTITDQGFVMSLSPRVPISLQRTVRGVTERLLAPHDLDVRDISHWMVHPGGPAILDAVQAKLGLSEEQMADSRTILAEYGNCSSATILLILERLIQSGRAKPGEWAVMMAFGPGLTIETCLLRC
jgi:predicted naringenin-chalcone synthase